MYNSLDGYESPIWAEVKKFCDRIVEERENALMMRLEEQTALHIDKDELVKALNYDRDQYSKGYSNGYNKGYEKGREDAIENLKEVLGIISPSEHAQKQYAVNPEELKKAINGEDEDNG